LRRLGYDPPVIVIKISHSLPAIVKPVGKIVYIRGKWIVGRAMNVFAKIDASRTKMRQ
jgi:hypothetical protein